MKMMGLIIIILTFCSPVLMLREACASSETGLILLLDDHFTFMLTYVIIKEKATFLEINSDEVILFWRLI